MGDNKENRKLLDMKIREVLRKKEDIFPGVWKEVKTIKNDPNRMVRLVKRLKGFI